MVIEVVCVGCHHLFHVFAHFKQDYVWLFIETCITIHCVNSMISFSDLPQENSIRFALWDHKLHRLMIIRLSQPIEVRWLIITQRIVDVIQNGSDCGCGHRVFTSISDGQPLQILIRAWWEVRRNTILINLWVLRQIIEKRVQPFIIKPCNALSWVNSWYFRQNIKIISQCWYGLLLILPIILNCLQSIYICL